MAEEVYYPKAKKISLVWDNLSKHSAAFHKTFSAEQARRLARRIESRYTPVHCSWLNMVEIELSVLVRQCLRRTLADIEPLGRKVEAWAAKRNRLGAVVDWRSTTAYARTKLRKLFPSINPLRGSSRLCRRPRLPRSGRAAILLPVLVRQALVA